MFQIHEPARLRRHLAMRAVLLSIALGEQACSVHADANTAASARIVQVTHPVAAARRTLDLTGTVHAGIESEPGFRVAGAIAEQLVDRGQNVHKGQPLLRLDPQNLELAARAADSRAKAAEALALQAAAEEQRERGLVDSDGVSRSAYEAAVAASQSAAENWKTAQDAARDAALTLSYATLRADADGTVLDILAQPGQVIAAGTAVIRFARSGTREIVVSIPESEFDSIPKSGSAQRYGSVDTIKVTLQEVAGVADPVTRTYQARYRLPPQAESAPLGSTYTIHLALSAPAALSVPSAAVYDSGKGTGVWIIGSDHAAHFQPVTVIGLRDSDTLIQSSMITRQTLIVSTGAHLVRDGELVRFADAST